MRTRCDSGVTGRNYINDDQWRIRYLDSEIVTGLKSR